MSRSRTENRLNKRSGTGLSHSLRKFAIKILSRYFRIVPLPPNISQITAAPDHFTIITESASFIVEALLHSFALRSGLSKAVHASQQNGERDKQSLYWLSLHESAAIHDLASREEGPAFITLNIFSERGPFKSNPSYRLGFWDLTGILILGRFLVIFFGEPVSTASMKGRQQFSMVRNLRIDLYKNLKLVRGTPFQNIDDQARAVIGGAEFHDEIKHLSEKLSISEAKLKSRARAAFFDIAANPKRPMYRIIAFIARVTINRLFSTVKTYGLDRLSTAVRESTVVIVPMHRSHLDYILIGSRLYESKLNPPLVAAGINLSFWPIGFMIRSVGGYFVKRNARTDRLHALILKRYVSYLVKRGHLQEFFIEGGRSRSGKMRHPKLGLLNIFVDAYLKGYKRDIAFVPVSVTYENVIEDSVYGRENTGRAKEKENIFSLLRAGRILTRKYGDVMVNFGEPISLSSFAGANSRRKERAEDAAEPRLPVQELAYQISRAIRDQTNPGLTGLVHTALMMAPKYGLSEQALIEKTRNLATLLEYSRCVNPLIGEFTPTLKLFLSGRENILRDIARGGTIHIQPCLNFDTYFIPGEKRFTADFYKNSLIHAFLPFGIFSMLHLLKQSINRENVGRFYTLFRHDFLLDERERFLDMTDSLVKILLSDGVLKSAPENFVSYSNTTDGLFIPALLLPSIQSLIWVLYNLQYGEPVSAADNGEAQQGTSFSYDEFVGKLQREFRTAAYLGLMTCIESSSNVTIVSALETLGNLGVTAVSDKPGKQKKLIVKNTSLVDFELLSESNKVILKWQAESGSSRNILESISPR